MAEFEVTGVRYRMGDGLSSEERTRRAEAFIRSLEVGTPLILAAEPDNQNDSGAIAVYLDYTRRVGYIKHESCAEVKLLLDADGLCDAKVCGNDGHVTLFIEIPDAPDVIVPTTQAKRKLPECPLPQGIGLAYSAGEQALQVIAPRLLRLAVSAETAGAILDLAERYMPLSRLSFSREDDCWRDHILKQLRKACRLALPENLKARLEQLYRELHETVGDFHSTHEHWQHNMFDSQLELLRSQAEGEGGLFSRFERYMEDKPDILGSLAGWFGGMPHVELRDYKDHGSLAERLSYMHVSRQELYEVYAAVLLLDRYGRNVSVHPDRKPKAVRPKAAKPKTNSLKKPPVKPQTLKYYNHGNNGILMKQRKRVDIVFLKFNEWGWIDNKTIPEDFDSFFEGEPRHCNITWKGNSTILTILLQELLKQPYITKQTGCSAKSMVEQQFHKTANSDRTRLDADTQDKIKLALIILDISMPLPERYGRYSNDYDEDDYDIQDSALMAIYEGELRSTKRI